MENQYNYYNQENSDSSYQYGGSQYSQQPQQDPQPPKEKKPRRKMPKAVAVTGLALLFGVVSSATFLTSNIIGNRILGLDDSSQSSSDTSKAVNSNATLSRTSSVVTSDVSDIVEKVMPSIVSITNMSVEEVQSFFGGVSEQTSESAGTGIIISQNDTELLIVTNNHVAEGSDTLTVTFDDGSSVEANIKGTNSEYDVAVIAVPLDSISDHTMDAITVATLGDSTNLNVGVPAIALGYALGDG